MSTWEERWHPLRQEWIIVAAHRQNRPWLGGMQQSDSSIIPPYVEDCYLCPGNTRVVGARNPHYTSTFVFDNDLPCVGEESDEPAPAPFPYQNRRADGIARVVCYSPRHDQTLADLSVRQIDSLLATWQEQYLELGARPEVNHVLIFENKGHAVGVSNPHPHCQIYATNFVFKHIQTEVNASREHLNKSTRPLFQDILTAEISDGRRIISENEQAIAFIPYFARYAYEVYVAPRKTYPHLAALAEEDRLGFAQILRDVVIRFDNLWQTPFPYIMALHQAPTDGADYSSFHFHIEFHPPLRKPNLLKYLAGPEIGGGNFVTDTAPENSAAELRNLSSVHYKQSMPESFTAHS
jgi:UDPglucose--hexose-1-phosphate uridylyltransferase